MVEAWFDEKVDDASVEDGEIEIGVVDVLSWLETLIHGHVVLVTKTTEVIGGHLGQTKLNEAEPYGQGSQQHHHRYQRSREELVLRSYKTKLRRVVAEARIWQMLSVAVKNSSAQTSVEI